MSKTTDVNIFCRLRHHRTDGSSVSRLVLRPCGFHLLRHIESMTDSFAMTLKGGGGVTTLVTPRWKNSTWIQRCYMYCYCTVCTCTDNLMTCKRSHAVTLLAILRFPCLLLWMTRPSNVSQQPPAEDGFLRLLGVSRHAWTTPSSFIHLVFELSRSCEGAEAPGLLHVMRVWILVVRRARNIGWYWSLCRCRRYMPGVWKTADETEISCNNTPLAGTIHHFQNYISSVLIWQVTVVSHTQEFDVASVVGCRCYSFFLLVNNLFIADFEALYGVPHCGKAQNELSCSNWNPVSLVTLTTAVEEIP